MAAHQAPELDVTEWLGEPKPLAALRGRVVLLEAFQMLCPGCVNHALPQAKRVQQQFRHVEVVGLHTVFEHHAVTGPDALRVFLAEFGYTFSVGVDRHEPGSSMPVTMRGYDLQGTPSTVLIDRAGRVRLINLGTLDDLVLGANLGLLLAEPPPPDPDCG